MKRRLITIVITLLVLLGLNFGIIYFTHTKFFDYSFFIGLAATAIIWFFTSKGGFGSRRLDMTIQGSTGIRMESQKVEFSPNIAFFTSLAYTIITFVAMLYHYRSYF
ncbi:hypothetical protein [Psychrobacillus vulpis]|uniref:DUF3899 domain-containing protein n=1 Tax=Psychrobacillus vulpis TaxID=2325572 RepID=A0A544TDJ4_9BACI|nr:hypothetical protein [Psychrobacillus vulpis]TQR15515.1 hypothetical protein FG384_19220 [Psychrobacillus vulpis]